MSEPHGAAELIRAQLPHTLADTSFPSLGTRYRGKVRDTYTQGDRLVLITTDRVSAFDHVLTTLPFKGDLLNQLSAHWFGLTRSVLPNHVVDVPDPCVTVARVTRPLPIEFVVRGYLTGSLWRDYQAGQDPYGLALPPGLRKDERFERPLLTPSTKAPQGQHDEPVSEEALVARGLVTARLLAQAKEAVLALFAVGQAEAARRGLLLVDTKYELGLLPDGSLMLIDEVHTPDSSRYWRAEGSQELFQQGQPQRMLDKENLRQWLITERGFSGHGVPPAIPDDVRVSVTQKYLEAAQAITGRTFDLAVGDVRERLTRNLQRAGLLPAT